MDVFLSAFQQMLYMFLFMLLGYVLRKKKWIPENSSSVLSKLENLIFMPCVKRVVFRNDSSCFHEIAPQKIRCSAIF